MTIHESNGVFLSGTDSFDISIRAQQREIYSTSIDARGETSDELADLVRRLRAYAKTIDNRADSQTVDAPVAGRNRIAEDMLAAAMMIEQRQRQLLPNDILTNKLLGDLPTDEAMALAQIAKRFLYEDAERFSNRHDGGAERDAMLRSIGKLQSALADRGYAPR
jgi:hypothetical protein